MKNKKLDHIEKAFFENRVASNNDCTGYMVTPPTTEEQDESISDLLNVPPSKQVKSKK